MYFHISGQSLKSAVENHPVKTTAAVLGVMTFLALGILYQQFGAQAFANYAKGATMIAGYKVPNAAILAAGGVAGVGVYAGILGVVHKVANRKAAEPQEPKDHVDSQPENEVSNLDDEPRDLTWNAKTGQLEPTQYDDPK